MQERQMKCLVVGCGRSGTGLVSSILSSNGLGCGHQRVFTPWTLTGRDHDFSFESSWLAAPYIDEIENLTHIIHVVRDPAQVVSSFVKIGVFASIPYQHITQGHPLDFVKKSAYNYRFAKERFRYVYEMRKFLKKHTSAFSYNKETKRIEAYWRQWNEIIEKKSHSTPAKYGLFTLESISQSPGMILDFIGHEKQRGGDFKLNVVNEKRGYKKRTRKNILDEATQTAAKHYGVFA